MSELNDLEILAGAMLADYEPIFQEFGDHLRRCDYVFKATLAKWSREDIKLLILATTPTDKLKNMILKDKATMKRLDELRGKR